MTCSLAFRVVCTASLLLGVTLGGESVAAEQKTPATASFNTPVMRTTSDRDGDLIDAMIRRGMLDKAELICRAEQSHADPLSDAFAKWTIRRSKVLTQRQLSSDDFDDQRLEIAARPIDELLRRYPDHPRSLFLRAAILEVRRSAAHHDVVIAVVRPSGSSREQRALGRIASLSSDVDEMGATIDNARNSQGSRSANRRDDDDALRVPDLVRLQQENLVLSVSIQLLQTELFATGSRDGVATATAALAATDQAIAHLPPGSLARREIERMRILAMLRSGDPGRARKEFERLQFVSDDAQARAIRVQIEISANDLAAAKELIDEFDRSIPVNGDGAIEMDFAKLAYLVAADNPGVGDWLSHIDKRHGNYASRRAEAISLRSARSGKIDSAVSPALVAAQGRDWLRRGDRARAADLLAAAARAEVDHDLALQYAKESAAVLFSIERKNEACEVLAELSILKRDAKSAAAAQLQSALVLGKNPTEVQQQRIEKSLRATIQYWPASMPAKEARRWLVSFLYALNRLPEATEIATHIDADPEKVYYIWREAFHTTDSTNRGPFAQRFIQLFEPLVKEESWNAEYQRGAVMFLDRQQLAKVQPPETGHPDAFLGALSAFRCTGVVTDAIKQPSATLVDDAKWRLREDGLIDPGRQKQIAAVMASWNSDEAETLDRALELVWLGEVESAVALIGRLIDQSESPGTTTRAAAEMLTGSTNPKARSHAVVLWDELSNGLPKRSESWYQAKLNAIKALHAMSETAEAKKRARYILLMFPPSEPDAQAVFEKFAERTYRAPVPSE